MYIVKETEISEVLTKGYTDDLDIDFAKQKVEELTERIQNAPSVAPTAEQSKVEVSNNNGLTT